MPRKIKSTYVIHTENLIRELGQIKERLDEKLKLYNHLRDKIADRLIHQESNDPTKGAVIYTVRSTIVRSHRRASYQALRVTLK